MMKKNQKYHISTCKHRRNWRILQTLDANKLYSVLAEIFEDDMRLSEVKCYLERTNYKSIPDIKRLVEFYKDIKRKNKRFTLTSADYKIYIKDLILAHLKNDYYSNTPINENIPVFFNYKNSVYSNWNLGSKLFSMTNGWSFK